MHGAAVHRELVQVLTEMILMSIFLQALCMQAVVDLAAAAAEEQLVQVVPAAAPPAAI
jgi:hypothetical protein